MGEPTGNISVLFKVEFKSMNYGNVGYVTMIGIPPIMLIFAPQMVNQFLST